VLPSWMTFSTRLMACAWTESVEIKGGRYSEEGMKGVNA